MSVDGRGGDRLARGGRSGRIAPAEPGAWRRDPGTNLTGGSAREIGSGLMEDRRSYQKGWTTLRRTRGPVTSRSGAGSTRWSPGGPRSPVPPRMPWSTPFASGTSSAVQTPTARSAVAGSACGHLSPACPAASLAVRQRSGEGVGTLNEVASDRLEDDTRASTPRLFGLLGLAAGFVLSGVVRACGS